VVAPVLATDPPAAGAPAQAPGALGRPAPAVSGSPGGRVPGSVLGSVPGARPSAAVIAPLPAPSIAPAPAPSTVPTIAPGIGRAIAAIVAIVANGAIGPSGRLPALSAASVPIAVPASAVAIVPLAQEIAFPGPLGPPVRVDPSARVDRSASAGLIALQPPPATGARRAGNPAFPAVPFGRAHRRSSVVVSGPHPRSLLRSVPLSRAVKPPAMPPMSAAT
jgi:hypothetical protein